MRTRRSMDKRLSPVGGKREGGRSKRGRKGYPEPRIRFTPRPRTTVKLHEQVFDALLDGGSEISLINSRTAEILTAKGVAIREERDEIQLADGSTRSTKGTMEVETNLHNRTAPHSFTILPDMEDDVILGIDGQAKFRVGIPPPPRHLGKKGHRCHATGLAGQTAEQKEQLGKFLAEEFERFKSVQGRTTKIQHVIRLKDDRPIKQRYRPRNPAMQEIIDKEVDEMLEQGVIEPAHSPWSSPIVIVGKKDGKHRFLY